MIDDIYLFLYMGFIVFILILFPTIAIFSAGRRNIKVYLSKFDLIGLHLIFPLVIFPIFVAIYCAVCEYFDVSNNDGLSYIFYTMLFIIAIYAVFGFYVCIKYNHGFLNCFWALLLRLFGKLRFSLYNMIVFRKNYDKDKVAGRDEINSNDKVLVSKEEWDEFLKWKNSRES